MSYDYIIIGGSIAGSVCAYELCRKGSSCLVLEQCGSDHEKVCGGGISYKAIDLLLQADIEVEPLFKSNSQAVLGHIIYKDDNCTEKIYKAGNVSLGIQRHIFDEFMRRQAQRMGADICFEHKVSSVVFDDKEYYIDGYSGSQLIWAIGARSLEGTVPSGQSIGISGQIEGTSDLNENMFYYWYYVPTCESKYFWAFPIGKNLWNVGLWSRYAFNELRYEFEICLDRYFFPHIHGEWKYFRKPKAEFLGHHDQRIYPDRCLGIGDFAGMCNPINGGGIIGAIKSAITIIDSVVL